MQRRPSGLSILIRVFTGALAMAAGPVLAQTSPPAPGLESLSTPAEIRAQVRPRHHAVLSAEMGGKILELPFRDGEAFRRGDRLIVFDCAAQRARRDQAAAAAQAAARRREVSGKLDQLNSISMLELATAESAEAEAKAELALADVMVRRCVIAAPYDGRMAGVEAQRYAFAAEGAPLVAIYDAGAFDVEMIVPSAWIAWLKPGHAFRLKVDETGGVHEAEVTRLSGQVDPVSQSVRVYGRIKGDVMALRPGMSGSVALRPPGAGGTP
ncbi:efflux RND transporter periplasmic adaptor subunit [Niveispirillum fermenti]|uniref:efflux RND transporter periplasmic adaptor subunit n=1 Tax=Niveispirillum fermenti TaxID=1233113 RepID=UPI003A893CE4